jgi:hypothetical protein
MKKDMNEFIQHGINKDMLVNHVDVAYRDLENLDTQWMIMKNILNNFSVKDLKVILKSCKMARKVEIKEDKSNVAIGTPTTGGKGWKHKK